MAIAILRLFSRSVLVVAFAVTLALIGQEAYAVLPQAGDIAFGLSNTDPTLTLELVHGSAALNGGTTLTSPWQITPFIEVVKFDNLGGIAHNVHGNLIGVDFGGPSDTGKIYNMATTVDPAPSQQIGDTLGMGGSGLSLNRLAGLSVSPDNSKIAIMGYTSGAVLVYDYTAGNSMGAGAALAGGRQTPDNTLDGGHTQGTVWKNNNTVIAFGSTGKLFEINPTTMVPTLKATLPTTEGLFANFTSVAYEPGISPYLYASWGGFDGVATENKLFVVDPATYSVVKQIDLSTSLQTGREIALDQHGNLFMSQYGGTGTDGAKLDFIPANMILNPASLTDNSSIDWYQSTTLSSFSSFDIGYGPAVLPGDYNDNDVVDAADYVVWRKNKDTANVLPNDPLGGTIGAAQYDQWRANFGKALSGGSGAAAVALGGSGANIPEPSTLVLFAIGCATVVGRRHRGLRIH